MRTEIMRTAITSISALLLCGLCLSAGTAYAQDKKPNIVVIWGDDIGQDDISADRHAGREAWCSRH